MTLLPKARRSLVSMKTRPPNRAILAYHRVVAMILSPDVLTTVAFGLIGLLLTLNLMLRYPELATIIEQYNQF